MQKVFEHSWYFPEKEFDFLEVLIHFNDRENYSHRSLGNLDSMGVSFTNTTKLAFL